MQAGAQICVPNGKQEAKGAHWGDGNIKTNVQEIGCQGMD